MPRVSQMQDIPWHLETLHRQDNDPRRHRSRCKYYNKKTSYCSRRSGKCMGSAHCMEYEEPKEEKSKNNTKDTNKTKKTFSSSKEMGGTISAKYDAYRRLGARVVHSKFGKGKVIKADNANVTIQFECGYEGKFGIQFSVDNGIIKLI